MTILGGALLSFALAVGMCIMISITVPTPTWLGYAIFCGIVILTLTLVSAELWFNTLKPQPLLVLMLVLAVGLHVSIHVWLLATFTAQFDVIIICVSMVAYPAATLLLAALYKFRDDHYCPSRFVTLCVSITELLMLGLVVALFFATVTVRTRRAVRPSRRVLMRTSTWRPRL